MLPTKQDSLGTYARAGVLGSPSLWGHHRESFGRSVMSEEATGRALGPLSETVQELDEAKPRTR